MAMGFQFAGALILAGVCMASAQDGTSLRLMTATRHPMQYFISLPEGWSARKAWPAVVIVESANRQFSDTAEVFRRARGGGPFILLIPLVVTNGGAGVRSVPSYHYTDAVWNEIERAGPFRFDAEGIRAMIGDVHNSYGGEEKYFLTGWEAGGHTVWATIFQHPEELRAAAPVSTNYAGRWMDAAAFSLAPARVNLPIRILQVDGLPAPLLGQIAEARKTAEAHGYRNVTVSLVSGKPHGPLADETLDYFASLLGR
jgi:dienelactone hydrolase